MDGQQRLTTLSILLYCLGYEPNELLQEKYNQLSNEVIVTNHNILSKRISEQEAFQFFDSQNTRGKELAPHDLLKSYHLREMVNEDEHEKIRMINQWENMNRDDLNDLFKKLSLPIDADGVIQILMLDI